MIIVISVLQLFISVKSQLTAKMTQSRDHRIFSYKNYNFYVSEYGKYKVWTLNILKNVVLKKCAPMNPRDFAWKTVFDYCYLTGYMAPLGWCFIYWVLLANTFFSEFWMFEVNNKLLLYTCSFCIDTEIRTA